MKRFIALLLSLLMVICICGACTKDTEDFETDSESVSDTVSDTGNTSDDESEGSSSTVESESQPREENNGSDERNGDVDLPWQDL